MADVVDYLDAYRVAIRQGIGHQQALLTANKGARLSRAQLKNMQTFIEMNRDALTTTESREVLVKYVSNLRAT